MESTKDITITLNEYHRLKQDSLFLECLDGAGVDNWAGYDEAQKMYQQYKEEEQC